MSLDPVALLERMLSIPSPSGREGKLACYLAEAMAGLGFRAWVDEVGNAVGERGEGQVEVVLLGHMDTVQGEIAVRRVGKLLYGRGAVDAKGPLAAFIAAASRVDPPRGVKLAIVGAVEEEAATSAGARHILGRYSPASVVIGEPSGWDRVTIGYKGRLLLDYHLESDAAHSARDEATVCERAVNFWLWVRGFADAYGAHQPRRFDRVDSALRRFESGSDGLREWVDMEVALRLPPGFPVADFRGPAVEAARPAQLGFRGYEPAYRADKNTPLVRAFLAAVRAQGGQPRFSVKMGTSDMNVVGPVWNCPIVAYGPGDSDLDHTPDEHLDLEEYHRGIAVLESALSSLMRDLASG
ncbi:MAG: [LysW]-lysine hydrolase [Anaerolineae bacterium]|nr:[LysW]-lysine hydrolase [Anaerolineae bacterium]